MRNIHMQIEGFKTQSAIEEKLSLKTALYWNTLSLWTLVLIRNHNRTAVRDDVTVTSQWWINGWITKGDFFNSWHYDFQVTSLSISTVIKTPISLGALDATITDFFGNSSQNETYQLTTICCHVMAMTTKRLVFWSQYIHNLFLVGSWCWESDAFIKIIVIDIQEGDPKITKDTNSTIRNVDSISIQCFHINAQKDMIVW